MQTTTTTAPTTTPDSAHDDRVRAHYEAAELVAKIRQALVKAGKQLDALGPEDLAAVDAFHSRGRPATVELAQKAELRPGLRVLDVGAGIGGTVRHLAATYGVDATGVDLTESFCAAATELSAMVGLSASTRFRAASAVELPYHDESFDVVWTEHVQMNIADKKRFYAEATRVLSPGGRLVFHDLFQGPGGEPHFPAPWAEDASISHLCTPDDARDILAALGLEVVSWDDTSEQARAFFETAIARTKANGPPPVGLHLIIPRAAPTKLSNLLRSLAEQRVAAVQAILRKPA